MKIHTGEKNYECKVCGIRFAHRKSIILHFKKHIADK